MYMYRYLCERRVSKAEKIGKNDFMRFRIYILMLSIKYKQINI